MISLEQAKALALGDILHETGYFNADGTCRRWRVNGRVRTWKRDASRVHVPIKHGLYSYDALTSLTALGTMHFPDDATCLQCQAARKG